MRPYKGPLHSTGTHTHTHTSVRLDAVDALIAEISAEKGDTDGMDVQW